MIQPADKSEIKIAVLMGGISNEREVSLKTGAAVLQALEELGYQGFEVDTKYDIATQLIEIKPDLAFIALHGTYGEDGCVQGLLEYLKIPYTHSGVTASAICMNKEFTQMILSGSGLKIAKNHFFSKFADIDENIMEYPYVIKPVAEGSSVGVSIIKNPDDFAKAKSEWTFDRGMVEKFIEGKELSVAVLDNPYPEAIGVIELKPNSDFYDYEAKYTDGVTEHILPASLTAEEISEVKDLALKCHKVLQCAGVSRTDFRYDGNDFFVLETNTHPGMTELSLVPEIAEFVGINFKNLIEILVNQAKNHNS